VPGFSAAEHPPRLATVAAAIALALIAVLGGFAGSAYAATTTTINFDDLSPSTVVSTQYDSEGVDFVTGIVGFNVYCYPTIMAVGSKSAESGTQVANANCADGEFPNSSIRGNLTNSADSISVYAGYTSTSAGAPASESVTLTAYDVNGDVVNSQAEAVPTNTGTHTLLAVTSSSPNITSFDVTADGPGVSIDNLTYDNPGGVPADFTIKPASGFVQLPQGSQMADQVTIQRLNGSFGDITFSASGLPAGVQASFSPNPATGTTATMTLSAAANATVPTGAGAFPTVTVTGTPANAGVGSTARTAGVEIDLQSLFSINAPETVGVPPCSTLKIPVSVNAASGFSGPVALAVQGVPSDDQATLSPSTLSEPGQTESTLTLTSQSDTAGPAGDVTVTASANGVVDPSSPIAVSRVAPSITSVTNPAGSEQPQSGQTPQGGSPDLGTALAIHGFGFCPGSTVYFGNSLAQATADGPSPDGRGQYGDGTALFTSVPSLATSGSVYVIPPGGPTATAPFTIDNYRDTDGFSFNNNQAFQDRVGGYSFSDLTDVFGSSQTYASINPCWPFGTCNVVTPIPNPGALILWGIANEALQDGQCFGFSLASQRFLHGDAILPAYPAQTGLTASSVWDLQGPDPSATTSGASGSIAHYIHLMHLEQISSEALHFWLAQAASNLISGSQTSIMDSVTERLDRGDHPLVELRNGTSGHVVVAYEVDEDFGNSDFSSGDRVIDVYNPNQQFTTGENNSDGKAHKSALSTSEIIVHPDGSWVFDGFDPSWHGGPGSIVVVPYGTVPTQPTLPATLSGLFDLLFGSAGATQVTASDGHTLLTAAGDINNDPATKIDDATQFATLSGTNAPGPDIFLLGHSDTYTTTVRGKRSGSYHDVLFGRGMTASLTTSTAAGVVDRLSVPAGADGLAFGQTGGTTSAATRDTKVQVVVDGSQHSTRTATIATTMPTGSQAGLAFTATHGAVTVTSGGSPMTFKVMLSWLGPDGVPQTFAAPTVHLTAGARASLIPSSWSSLQTGAMTLRVVGRNGSVTARTLRNEARAAGRYTIALKVARHGSRSRLQITSRFTRVPSGSVALLTWEVRKGRRLVAHHTVSLTARKLHRGLVQLSYSPKRLASGHYIFQGAVEMFSPAKDGSFVSQERTESRGFRG
jgi:hypothetical protein